MSKSKEEIIGSFITAYNSFDIDAMLLLVHANIEFKNISNGEVDASTAGKDEFEKLARQSVTLFKEREQTIISYKEINDKVIVEIQYRAILAIDLPNGLKSGDTLDMRGSSEYIFKDGLIFSLVDQS